MSLSARRMADGATVPASTALLSRPMGSVEAYRRADGFYFPVPAGLTANDLRADGIAVETLWISL